MYGAWKIATVVRLLKRFRTLQDSIFVRKIAERYPHLALVGTNPLKKLLFSAQAKANYLYDNTANLRCGAWYTPPSITAGSSYFKSTDGHMSEWGFSLKRSNLDVAELILKHHGCIIVDSTRRGKSMPDALSKTIPIWCAVLNLASQLRWGSSTEAASSWEDHAALRTPDDVVSRSEHDQIAKRIEEWTAAFLESDLEIPRLNKPLKPIFITPQQHASSLPNLDDTEKLGFCPVLCLSASRSIRGTMAYAHSTPVQPYEAAEGIKMDCQTFVYMQGAGDDHENWADGLTPSAWWDRKNHARLLGPDSEDVEEAVREIVEQEKHAGRRAWFVPRKTLGGEAEESQDSLARVKNTRVVVRAMELDEAKQLHDARLVIACDGYKDEEEGEKTKSQRVVPLGLSSSKRSLAKFNQGLRDALVSTSLSHSSNCL
jgi:Rit1 N-terminal domain